MAINLAEKFSPHALQAFTLESVVAGKSSKEFDFDGVISIKIYTNKTVPLGDYNRAASANRYGTPAEVADDLQVLTMSQDKSFTATIDKGNASDQLGIKKAAKWLKQQMDEVVTPTVDKYCIGRWILGAGKVAGLTAAPDADWDAAGICQAILAGWTHLNNKKVPSKNRTVYIRESDYAHILNTKERNTIEPIGQDAMRNGAVGRMYGMTLCKVPDDYFPTNSYFLIVYKGSVLAPFKLRETKLHNDPPGINGNLIEGRFYYDAFVLETRADGVYAAVNGASSGGVKLAAPTIAEDNSVDGKFTIVCTNATTIKYTDDGSDPRYSSTAKTYGGAVTLTATKTIRAVGYGSDDFDYFPSDVAKVTITVGS